MKRLSAAAFFSLVTACSGSSGDPLLEYPPGAGDPGGDTEPGGPTTPSPPPSSSGPAEDGGAQKPTPIAGKKLSSANVMLEDLTSDGHLVFMQDADLMVWPDGAAAAATVQKDFDPTTDTLEVRGRFVATWLGDDVFPAPLTYWAKSSGIVTIAAETYRTAVYPRPNGDELAYFVKGSSSLRRTLRVTKAGGGPGVAVVSNMDLGLVNEACRATVTFVGSELLVAGCANGGTTPRVSVHAVDGSASRVLLERSAPGVWVNHARTHAIVQTSTASSIRAVAAGAAPVALDGPVRSALFSGDDASVVYRDATNKLKRAASKAPASPTVLAPLATALFDVSRDGRFTVFATKGDPARFESDLLVVDATTPNAARTFATAKAAFHGLSSDGTKLVYTAPRELGAGPLYVATLPSGAPQKVSDAASGVVLSADVVYFEEYVKATKTNALKAVRLSAPASVVTIDQGLDPLTARVLVAGKKIFVGSKLGLWEYPALTP